MGGSLTSCLSVGDRDRKSSSSLFSIKLGLRNRLVNLLIPVEGAWRVM